MQYLELLCSELPCLSLLTCDDSPVVPRDSHIAKCVLNCFAQLVGIGRKVTFGPDPRWPPECAESSETGGWAGG